MSSRPPSKRPPGRPKGRGRIDWGVLETLYVHGEPSEDGTRKFPSYASLATRFGVGVGSVAAVASEGGWPAKREAFQRQLREEIDRKCIENASVEAGRLVGVGLRAASEVALMLRRLLGPGAPPGEDARWTGPNSEVIERAGKLSVIYRNLCHGVYLARGFGGTGLPPSAGEETPKAATSEETRARVIDALAQGNASPETHGAATGDEG